MSRINRRNFLVGSAVFGTTVSETGIAPEQRRDQKPSLELTALIVAHEATYDAFLKAIRKPHGTGNIHAECSRVEEKALLAVCGFPAISEADRRAKATYLLQIEACGELDLREHMQTVLLSMM